MTQFKIQDFLEVCHTINVVTYKTMSKNTEKPTRVSEQISAANTNNSSLETANQVDTAIQDTNNHTRRKIIQALGFSAAGAILYQTLDKFFRVESMTIQELPPDPKAPYPYDDFDNLPDDITDQEPIQLPAEIDSGVIPTHTTPYPETPTNEGQSPTINPNCKTTNLYKPNGRINLSALRKALKD